ncbi:MAG: peroxidase-related enzyme [Vicinamibacterales bacterium]
MSYLPAAELPKTFGPFAKLQERFGFVPNIFRAQTLLPRAIEAEAGIAEAVLLSERDLTRVEKERLLLRIAGAHGNTCCVTAHSEMLRSLGVPDQQIDLIASDHRIAGLSSPDAALLDFAVRLSRTPTRITRADVDLLRGCGFSDEQILEAVAVTGLTEFLCCLSVGLGVTPDSPPRRAPVGAEAGDSGPVGTAGHRHAAGPYLGSVPLTEQTFPPFAFFREKFGFIPNIFRAQTLRPDFVEAEARMVDAVLLTEDVLSRVRKEFILLVVSAASLNTYCVAVHCEMLRALGVPAEDSDRIAVDHHRAGLSAADTALLDFALALARRPAQYGRADVDALRRSGFADVEILEAIVMTALTAFLNTLQMGLGTVPDFEPLRVFRPTGTAAPGAVTQHPTGVVASAADAADADLVRKAQAGDLGAFEALVRRHHTRVFRTLVGMTGSPEDAEDDLQGAFLKAYQHLREFEGRSSFSSWLTRIAINEALQRLRAQGRAGITEDGPEVGEAFRPREIEAWDDNPEQRYSKKELRELVEREILKLPAIYRTAVVLRDLEQLSTDQAAAALGIEVTTLKWRLHQGRLLLREALAPRFSQPMGRSHV